VQSFSVRAPLARDLDDVTVVVSQQEAFSNFHYTILIHIPGHPDQEMAVRNGQAVTFAGVRLADVNADGFLDLMIVGGVDHRGEPWFKTWLYDQEQGVYRWIND